MLLSVCVNELMSGFNSPPGRLNWVQLILSHNSLNFILYRVRTQVLESPGILKFGFQACKVLEFVEVLESPGIWTYRSIFLIINIQ